MKPDASPKPTNAEPPPQPGAATVDNPLYPPKARLRRRLRRFALAIAIPALAGIGGCLVTEKLFHHTIELEWSGLLPSLRFRGLTADMTGREGLPPAAAPPAGAAPAVATAPSAADGWWPGWRGPGGQGISAETGLPIKWGPADNIAWRTELPGVGHSSPIIWGDTVFVTAARDGGRRRMLIALDRRDGKILRQSEVPDEDPGSTHQKHGYASSTPATDGRVVVAFFGNAGLVGFDFAGKQLWQVPLGTFTGPWGTASSPVIDRVTGSVYLCVDDDAGCFIAAFDTATGKERWRRKRDQDRSFSTPLIVELTDGRRELVVNGKGRVWAYDPATGEPLWLCNGMTVWVTPTVVAGDGLVFACSGRVGPTLAIRPGGRGDVTATHVVWQSERGAPYIPSPVLAGGRLYMVNDGGILIAYDAADGRKLYQKRLGGDFTASPIAADGRLYFLNEAGDTFVVKAGAEFELLATNSLGERCLASPAVAQGRLFIRTDNALYCIGK